jgi:hypothetical protein
MDILKTFKFGQDVLKDRKRTQSATSVYQSDIELPPDKNKLIRCCTIILKASGEKILKTVKEDLSNLMLNEEYYTNTLIEHYFEELENDWHKFDFKYNNEMTKLKKIKRTLNKELNELDKKFLLEHEYLPLRVSIENCFKIECQIFTEKFNIDILKYHSCENYLIWEDRKDYTTAGLVKKLLYKSLCKDFKSQLSVLAPYHNEFKTGKHSKIMEKILRGLTDYECFKYQYDFGQFAGGSRSYLSKFAESVEKITKLMIDRDKNNKKLLCAHYVWQLFACVLTIEKISKDILKLCNVNTIETVNEVDPGVYFTYLDKNLEKLSNEINYQIIIGLDNDEMDRYLNLIKNYQTTCVEIVNLIELVIPIFNSIVNFNKDKQPSSTRRRKVTGSDMYRPLSISSTDFYNRFSLIKNSYNSQGKVLEMLLT